ncbi:MAG TPA: methyltransferase [Candidatus Binatus sp.]|nr:methyltransferase [Candidatus Binatus sp.]
MILRRLVESVRRALAPPGIRKMIALGDAITASWVSQAIHAVAAAGVADLIGPAPVAVDELAQRAGVDEDALYRVLRMLVPAGLFVQHSGRRFGLTELGALLRSDHPDSMRRFAIYNGTPWHWALWGALEQSLRTGKPSLAGDSGKPLFEFLAEDADAAAVFDAAMADLSNARDVSAISGYDFSRYATVADIGGGEGRLIKSVLATWPNVKGVLFDRAEVIERARPRMEADGFASRCTLIAGSFFEAVPSDADAYVLKQVLHDWDDDKAALILSNCRLAMGAGACLIVIEMVVPTGAQPSLAKLSDIEMLVATGGRERTLDEYDGLFAAAGLRRTGTHATRSPFTLIEAQAAEGGAAPKTGGP